MTAATGRAVRQREGDPVEKFECRAALVAGEVRGQWREHALTYAREGADVSEHSRYIGGAAVDVAVGLSAASF